jgi:putative tricarboxylic transport membrane protein
MSDRLSALVLLSVGLWYGALALQIRNSFFSDPLGSKAFPIFVAILLIALSAIALLRTPRERVVWPPRASFAPLVVSLALFVAYAYALPYLGFFAANTLVFAGLGLVFGARLWKAAVAGVVASLALYVLFAVALDLYLPVGRLFEGWFG